MTNNDATKMPLLSSFPRTGVLRPEPAAAIILWTAGGEYLMQLRDDIPGIFYPGHYGLFGGAAHDDETILACAVRELYEEIGIKFQENQLREFCTLNLDFRPFGYGSVERFFFEIQVEPEISADIGLGEGQRAEFLPGERLLAQERVTPYDSFVLWQHWNVRLMNGTIVC